MEKEYQSIKQELAAQLPQSIDPINQNLKLKYQDQNKVQTIQQQIRIQIQKQKFPSFKNNHSQSNTYYVPIKQHLNQIYPQMPKYAADPTQSKFIQMYDYIMCRYQGHYGKQPSFFIKVPANITLFGDIHPYVVGNNNNYRNCISFCSLQEIIIAVGKNSSNQIRINNYQKAIYGELSLSCNPIDWKFQIKNQSKGEEKEFKQENTNNQESNQEKLQKLLSTNKNPIVQEYTNVIIATLKNSLGNDRNYLAKSIGMDILIYCNFIPEENLQWKTSLIYGLHTAFQCIGNPSLLVKKKSGDNSGTSFQFELPISSYRNVLKKTQNLLGDWRSYSSNILYSRYQSLFVELQNQFEKLSQKTQQNKEQLNEQVHLNQHEQFNIKFLSKQKNNNNFNLSFVIANSMTPLPKKLVQGKRFNLRQCQVLIAIQIIKAQLGITNKKIKSIKQLQENMSCSIKQLQQTIEDILPKDPLTHQQIQQLTQKTIIQILKEIPFANNVIDQNVTFQPYKRILYFVKQEILIRQLLQKLQSSNINIKSEQIASDLKNLSVVQRIFVQQLRQSTKNTQKYLNEPSQQIKTMIQTVKGLFKAYKVLGNGWGGNVLFVCEKQNANKIVQVLNKQFYLNEENRILLGDDLQMYTNVIQKTNNGIMILDPQSQIWY